MKCPNCFSEIDESTKQCSICGYVIQNKESDDKDESNVESVIYDSYFEAVTRCIKHKEEYFSSKQMKLVSIGAIIIICTCFVAICNLVVVLADTSTMMENTIFRRSLEDKYEDLVDKLVPLIGFCIAIMITAIIIQVKTRKKRKEWEEYDDRYSVTIYFDKKTDTIMLSLFIIIVLLYMLFPLICNL